MGQAWLLDTICSGRPMSLLSYVVNTVTKEQLLRAGFTGHLIAEADELI